MSTPAYIALGSNLGDRLAHLRAAVRALDAAPGCRLTARSSVYETEAHVPVPVKRRPSYLNAVVCIETDLTVQALLRLCMSIEREQGRIRTPETRWGNRTLDLDLLIFGDEVYHTEELTIPHPRMAERRFVLVPLAEIAAEVRVPAPFDETVATLRERCSDPAEVHKTNLWLDRPDYVAVEGVIGAGKTSLTRLLAETFEGQSMLESPDDNPFLADFYADPERWAFHTQLSYLATRYRQQKALWDDAWAQSFVASDYTFEKDRLFAHLNLRGEERTLYDTLYHLMEPNIRPPDLTIYLRSSLDRLQRNIKQRGHVYERTIPRAYLHRLSDAYDAHFMASSGQPVLIVEATTLDFVHNLQDLETLIDAVGRHPGTGTIRYLNPPFMGSAD